MHDKKCNRPVFPRVFPGQIHDDELVTQIERTRGFVQQQDLGPRHERLSHEHKLLLPTAQAAHRLPAQTVEPKFRQRVRHFFDLLVGHFPSENHFKGRQTAGNGFELWNIRNVPIRKKVAFIVVQGHVTRAFDQPRDSLDQCGLTHAVSANHRHHFSAMQRCGYIIDDVVSRKMYGQVPNR